MVQLQRRQYVLLDLQGIKYSLLRCLSVKEGSGKRMYDSRYTQCCAQAWRKHQAVLQCASLYLFCGRRSQGHEGCSGKLLPQPRKPPVRWPEVMTPRADAVRFIHSYQPKSCPRRTPSPEWLAACMAGTGAAVWQRCAREKVLLARQSPGPSNHLRIASWSTKTWRYMSLSATAEK